MPALVTPPLPEGVSMAVQVVGSAASIEIIRYVAQHGPARRAEIETAVTAGPSRLGRLLGTLVQQGILTTDAALGQGEGRGKKFTYSLDRGRLKQLMAQATEYMLDVPSDEA